MSAVLLFGSALLAHLALSGFLLRRFLSCTSHYSTVPSAGAYARSRQLAGRAQAEGLPLGADDFLVFGSSTHQAWSVRPWTLLFTFGGLAIWLLAVVARLSFSPSWLP